MSDEKFFNAIYEKYYNQIYKIIKNKLYSKIDGDISSCSQDTFLKAWKNIEYLKKHENVLGWLIITVMGVTSNFNAKYRVRQKRTDDSLKMEDIADKTDFAQNIIETANFEEYLKSNIVEKFLSQLSDSERLLYELKHIKKLSNEDIGGILKISANAVVSRNKRLIAKFKKNYL